MSTPVVQRALRRNGLPIEPGAQLPLPDRILRSRWTWAGIFLGLTYLACALAMYNLVTRPIDTPAGPVAQANEAAVQDAFWLALPTLLAWVVVFLWLDRFRPQRLLVWTLTVGWGAFVATYFSMLANNWGAQHLGVSGSGQRDPASAARVAIFVAPFVEEAAKATILFAFAIFVRYRLVSKLSGAALGGLSGIGFAFTENILYYGRAITYGVSNIATGNVDAAIAQLVRLRGVYTSFGHPLFTALTGIGIAIALRSRSKLVRVVAPLVGYLSAALLHGAFNATATLVQGEQLVLMYQLVALPFVISVAIFLISQVLREGRLIRQRLTDYVRVGWLADRDPVVFSKVRLRLWALVLALRHRGFWATLRLQRAMTELAYLRDAVTRGIVDEAGLIRERELLLRIRELRGPAVDDPAGLKLFTKFRRPRLPILTRRNPPPPEYHSGYEPAAPAGGPRFAPVDPNWGPPR